MEAEIKLRLPSTAAYQILSDDLFPFHFHTHLKENLFFDTTTSDLSSASPPSASLLLHRR